MLHRNQYVCQHPKWRLVTYSNEEEPYSHLLVSTSKARWFPLNESAALIWQLCGEVRTVESVARDVSEIYPDYADAEADANLGVIA